MSEPTVSVLMTSYNAGPYLVDAVTSVLEQTLTDLELVVIDDGSTDGSFDSLNHIGDSRLHVHHQEQRGLGIPVNDWFPSLRGEFVMRMDADDVSHPERAERQVEFLRAHDDLGVVGAQYTFFTDAGDGPSSHLPLDHDEIARGLAGGWHTISHPTTMFRRSLLERGLRYTWLGSGEDWSFLADASAMTRLAVVDDVLYRYRLSPESSAWSGSLQSILGLEYARARLAARAENRTPPNQEEFLATHDGLGARLSARSRSTSIALYRQALVYQIEGETARSRAAKVAAATLDPVKTVGWLRKQLAG